MSDLSLIPGLRLNLGESPLWDPSRAMLHVVDIVEGAVHHIDLPTSSVRTDDVGAPVGAVVGRRAGGQVVALRSGLAVLDGTGLRPLAHVEDDDGARLNDAACDAAGRILVGSTAGLTATGRGSLYRVDADRSVHRLLAGTTLSNGVGWSPDGGRLYFADSAVATVFVHPYDLASGAVGDGRPFAVFGAGEGAPDGLAVDTAGGVWVASFGGGFVRRYTAGGGTDRTVRLPCANVTNCCFGGAGMDELFVTTARIELGERELAEQPLAGAVFRFAAGVTGVPVGSYAG